MRAGPGWGLVPGLGEMWLPPGAPFGLWERRVKKGEVLYLGGTTSALEQMLEAEPWVWAQVLPGWGGGSLGHCLSLAKLLLTCTSAKEGS